MNKRRLRILLVEPSYRSTYLPLGLQKIATYHLRRGDEVRFIHEHPKRHYSIVKPDYYNRIYITSIFTYYAKRVVSTANYLKRLFPNSRIAIGGVFATLLPDYVKQKTGITPHIGLYDKVESLTPDYSLFPQTNQALIFTSRGCVHNCEFCAVSKLVPQFFITPFKEQIKAAYKAGFRRFNIQDDNFAATPYGHQKEVINFLASFEDITIDFNSGMDVRVFKEKTAKLLSKIRIPTIRFAFDSIDDDGYYQYAIELAQKHGIYKEEIVSYVLWNFEETLDDLWYRLNEVLKAGSCAYPMRYLPLDALDKLHIGKHWTPKTQHKFERLIRALSIVGQIIHPRGIDLYKNRKIGRSAEEFIELMNTHAVSGKYFGKLRKTKRARTTTLGLTDRSELDKSVQRLVKRGTHNEDGTPINVPNGKLTQGLKDTYYQTSIRKKSRVIKRR